MKKLLPLLCFFGLLGGALAQAATLPLCTEYPFTASGSFPATPGLDVHAFNSHYTVQLIVTAGTVNASWQASLSKDGSYPHNLGNFVNFTTSSGTNGTGEETLVFDAGQLYTTYLNVTSCTGSPCTGKVRFCASQY